MICANEPDNIEDKLAELPERVTARQLAQWLGVTTVTITNWLRDDALVQPDIHVRATKLWFRSTIARWIVEQRKRQGQESGSAA